MRTLIIVHPRRERKAEPLGPINTSGTDDAHQRLPWGCLTGLENNLDAVSNFLLCIGPWSQIRARSSRNQVLRSAAHKSCQRTTPSFQPLLQFHPEHDCNLAHRALLRLGRHSRERLTRETCRGRPTTDKSTTHCAVHQSSHVGPPSSRRDGSL